jgi:hypothetical protein
MLQYKQMFIDVPARRVLYLARRQAQVRKLIDAGDLLYSPERAQGPPQICPTALLRKRCKLIEADHGAAAQTPTAANPPRDRVLATLPRLRNSPLSTLNVLSIRCLLHRQLSLSTREHQFAHPTGCATQHLPYERTRDTSPVMDIRANETLVAHALDAGIQRNEVIVNRPIAPSAPFLH